MVIVLWQRLCRRGDFGCAPRVAVPASDNTIGAFLFGLLNHFLLPGSDNVAHVPPGVWQLPFQVTAVLLAILQALGTGIGVWCITEEIRAQALRRAEIAAAVGKHRVKGEI